MRKRGLRAGMTLLLVAAVMLGGVTPPAVQHAHADGHIAHDHHDASADRHAGDHSHPHPHRHDSDRASRVEHGSTAHAHLVLLGFELYLPRSGDKGAPQDPSDRGDDCTVLIRLFDSEVVPASGAEVWWVVASLLSSGTYSSDPVRIPCYDSSQLLLASLPLCDSARGERSGVQLI